MKESKLYLSFFKKHLLFFIVPALIGVFIGVYYQSRKPVIYTKTQLLEITQDAGSVNDRIAIADQAVTLSRSENVKEFLGVDPRANVVIFKPSPFSISVSVSSSDQSLLQSNLNKEVGYLTVKFPTANVGNSVLSETRPNLLVAGAVGGIVGLFLGLLLSLIESYLKNY